MENGKEPTNGLTGSESTLNSSSCGNDHLPPAHGDTPKSSSSPTVSGDKPDTPPKKSYTVIDIPEPDSLYTSFACSSLCDSSGSNGNLTQSLPALTSVSSISLNLEPDVCSSSSSRTCHDKPAATNQTPPKGERSSRSATPILSPPSPSQVSTHISSISIHHILPEQENCPPSPTPSLSPSSSSLTCVRVTASAATIGTSNGEIMSTQSTPPKKSPSLSSLASIQGTLP